MFFTLFKQIVEHKNILIDFYFHSWSIAKWLNIIVDDCQYGNITKLKKKKKNTGLRGSDLVLAWWAPRLGLGG
jgi:activator of HSP90 ATPase